MAASASSTGGLATFALKKLCWKSKRNHQAEETGGEQAANRSDRTQKREEANYTPPHNIVSSAQNN
jgi:hypothetical protein